MRPSAARPPAAAVTSRGIPLETVQEKALCLLACAACAALLAVQLRPEEPAPPPPEPEPAPPPAVADPVPLHGFQLAVLNGCGDSQVAARMTDKARGLGLDVIHEGNAPTFGFVESVVIDRSGDLPRARHVARLLGIPAAVQQLSDDAYRLEAVTVVVGRDYRRLGLFDSSPGPRN